MTKCLSILALVLTFFGLSLSSVVAADLRGNDFLDITSSTPLVNPYLAGERINVQSPVINDLVAAGGNIIVGKEVQGDILAAGGDLRLTGPTEGSVRVAGGNITLDGPIAEDLVVFGGNITLTERASVSGDVIFGGGTMLVNGPVSGAMYIYGGDVTLNSIVGKTVRGEVGTLTLGPRAQLNGDLSYKSPSKATMTDGAKVNGDITYTKTTSHEETRQAGRTFITTGAIYILLVDIIFTLALIWILPLFLGGIASQTTKNPHKSILVGFAVLILLPIASLFLLPVFWASITLILSYLILLLLTNGIMKALVGWRILTWWENRNNKKYTLNWKAGIIGPIIVTLISLIPVLGWLAVAILFLLALGGVSIEFSSLMSKQRINKPLK